jgi:hypothetical protein
MLVVGIEEELFAESGIIGYMEIVVVNILGYQLVLGFYGYEITC